MRRLWILLIVLAACGGGANPATSPTPTDAVSVPDTTTPSETGTASPAAFAITSPAFTEGSRVPVDFTCDGAETSPPLQWSGVPSAAAELALIVDDPDAPGGTFTHWTLWGLPPSTTSLDAGSVPHGARQGANDGGGNGYAGPCPPKGSSPHHYRFTLYVLRSALELQPGASPDDVRAAISSDTVVSATLTGFYSR